MKKFSLFTGTLILSCMFLNIANATDGHQLIGIGTLQKGTGGAGVANAKDATWLLLNPAAIIDLEKRTDINFEIFAPDRSITPNGPGSPLLGGASFANTSAGKMSDDSMFYIPSIGFIRPLEKGVLGFGLYGVNGMGVSYSQSRTNLPGWQGQNYDRKTEYAVMKIATAYAYPLADNLTIGAALNLDYSRFRSDMLTSGFTQTKGEFNWDDSFGFGFQLGIQKKWNNLALGATYISRQWMQEYNDYDDLLTKPLDLPQMFQIGISYKATSRIELLTDYKFIDWDSVEQLGDKPSQGGFGWKDQHILKAGAIWSVNDTLTVRSGISYGKSPIDEDNVFANSLFPAIVEEHLSMGFSYALNKNSVIHFTYMHAFENKLSDSGGGDMYSQFGAGTEITLEENTFTMGYSYLS